MINITIIPLSWAYKCPVKDTPDVSIEPGVQNCNKWLCNSIIYSTSCQTDDRTPSTIYNYEIQDSIDIVTYTSMPSPYLHSVSLLSKRSVTSLRQQTSRVVYPEVYLQQLAPKEATFFLMILDHPHPSIWLNSCLGHASTTAPASIVNMAVTQSYIAVGGGGGGGVLIGRDWTFLIGSELRLEKWGWFQNEAVGSNRFGEPCLFFSVNGISTFLFVEWIKTIFLFY